LIEKTYDQTVGSFLKMANPTCTEGWHTIGLPGWGVQIPVNPVAATDPAAMSPAEQEAILRKIESEKSELRQRLNVEHAGVVKAHWRLVQCEHEKGNLKMQLEQVEERISYWQTEEIDLMTAEKGLQDQLNYLAELRRKVLNGEKP
jgi:hypothetical protein